MTDRRRKIILGLLAAVAIQLFILVVAYERRTAQAQDAAPEESAVNANTLVAATGVCGIGDDASVLYVVDTERKQLAVYYSNGGKDIKFVAARKIFYDLELLYYNDETQQTHSVKKLKELYEKTQESGKDSSGTPRRRRS